MSWLFFTIVAAIFWGVGQVFIKKGFSKISTLWTIVISTIVNALIYIPFALANNADLKIDLILLPLIFFISFLYIFFFYAIEKGQLAFAGTIFATYPLTTIILSYIFLHERPSTFQYIMIVLILLGSILLSYFGTSKDNKKIKYTWILWAVLGAVTTGAGDFLAKIVLNNVQVNTYNFYYPLVYIISLGIFWTIDKKGRKLEKINIGQFKFTIIGITLLTMGLLSLNFAMSKGIVSIVTTVSSSYAALTILLSYLFLKESINKKQLFAIILIIIGIVFIGLG